MEMIHEVQFKADGVDSGFVGFCAQRLKANPTYYDNGNVL